MGRSCYVRPTGGRGGRPGPQNGTPRAGSRSRSGDQLVEVKRVGRNGGLLFTAGTGRINLPRDLPTSFHGPPTPIGPPVLRAQGPLLAAGPTPWGHQIVPPDTTTPAPTHRPTDPPPRPDRPDQLVDTGAYESVAGPVWPLHHPDQLVDHPPSRPGRSLDVKFSQVHGPRGAGRSQSLPPRPP